MLLEHLDDELREADGPLPRLGLRSCHDPAHADDLLRLDEDSEASVGQVDVAPPEPEQLACAQPDKAGDDHESS